MKKRMLALLTAAALLLTTATQPTQATQPTRPVEMSDVLDILKSIVGIAAPLSLDYDFNQNGVIDVGDALEGLKSLIGAREVVMLPIVVEIGCGCKDRSCIDCLSLPLNFKLEPLSEEIHQKIVQDFNAVMDGALEFDIKTISRYYGTYNGSVVFVPFCTSLDEGLDIKAAGYHFVTPQQAWLIVWNDGDIYAITNRWNMGAYELGLLTDKDIKLIWQIFARTPAYNSNYLRMSAEELIYDTTLCSPGCCAYWLR